MALPKRQPDEGQPPPAGDQPDWRSYYDIENLADVDAYVGQHPTAAIVLAEAPDEIKAVFGDRGAPKLALECDPEDGDRWLSVDIPAETSDESALSLIYDLEERWWLDKMRSTDAVIVFNILDR